jgi:hypothetical protein
MTQALAMNPFLEKALHAQRESKSVEFKDRFDNNQAQDWCEIVKDIVAMANSGGGCLLIGVNNNGSRSAHDVSTLSELDPAMITDKIAKYTGEQYADFELIEAKKNGHPVFAFVLGSTKIPLVFIQPGTYEVSPGKQKTAFAKGTVYFRHGAKSEPATSKDLRDFVDRLLEDTRKSWLGNIRKVVQAPTGYRVTVLPPDVVESSSPSATPIRIVDDSSAPAYRKIDPDKTHPYRLKEIVPVINQRLKAQKRITSYDIQCVRRVHKIDSMPAFFYHSKFASPQYSLSFVEWLLDQIHKDPDFVVKARGNHG